MDVDDSMSRRVTVRWRSSKMEFEVRTLMELREAVVKATGMDHLRLIFKGRLVEDLEAISGEVVLAVGTSAEEASRASTGVEDAAAERRRLRVRDVVNDLEHAAAMDDEMSEDEDNLVFGDSLHDEIDGKRTGFGRIEVLSREEVGRELREPQVAERMLRRLAMDAGVRFVMRRRGWFVPVLSEMYPDGKVGVDPVCVLGLNESKGARIRLRLRTDDLQGFRKLLSIKKVLYHELAHNERSEHDAIFYALVSSIDKEASAARPLAQRLGGAIAPPRGHMSSRPVAAQRLGGNVTLEEARNRTVGAFASSVCECCGQDPGVEESKSVQPQQADDEHMSTATSLPELTIDDTIQNLPPGIDPDSREAKILSASRELSRLDPPDVRAEAATTLQIILANLENTQSDAKFHRIRLTNKRFRRTAGKFAAALRLLEAVGFDKERDHDEEVLVFRRHDPGLLWLGRSALTEIVAVA